MVRMAYFRRCQNDIGLNWPVKSVLLWYLHILRMRRSNAFCCLDFILPPVTGIPGIDDAEPVSAPYEPTRAYGSCCHSYALL